MKRLWRKILWMTLTLMLIVLIASVPVYAIPDYDIGTVTEDIVLRTPGTYRITGTTETKSIFISPDPGLNGDFHILLDNVTITSTQDAAFKIQDNCINNVVIELVGKNTLTSPDNHAGIEKNGRGSVGTLTIKGDGELHAKGTGNAAGIGGSAGKGTDKIEIISGLVKAEGKHGIGAGQDGTGGSILIQGDIVTAIGSNISGKGFNGTATVDGDCVVMARGGGGANLPNDNIIHGAFIKPGNNTEYGSGYIKGEVILPRDLTLLDNYQSYISSGEGKLVIPEGRKIIIPTEKKFDTGIQIENNGIIENNGKLENKGSIENNGAITSNGKIYDYEGSEISGTGSVEDHSIIKVVEFNGIRANGEANIKDTDEITLTFNREVALTESDITLVNAELENVTVNGKEVVLKIKNLAETGNVKVTLSTENYLFKRWDYKWVQVNREKVYTVTFDAKEGTVSSETMTTVNGKIETPPTPTREGYTFEGWYEDQACTREWDNIHITADMTVYAKWLEEYDVTFMLYNGEADIVVKTVNRIVPPNKIPSTTKPHFQLEAWYTDAKFTEPWDSSEQIMQDMTVHAKWRQTEYKVTFEANNNTNPTSVWTVEKKVPVDKIPSPEREGYTFEGWYTDAALENVWVQETEITEDMTLYAKWKEQAPIEYTVTFDAKEGTVSSEMMTTVNGKIETPPTPTREGYTFEGWYTDSACTTEWDKKAIADLTVYAKWTKVEDDPEDTGEEQENPEEDTPIVIPDPIVEDKDDKIDDDEHFLPEHWFYYVQPTRATRREEEKEKPKTSDDFVDVPTNAFYKDAIDWAIENNITGGTSKTTFSPNTVCTRAETVTFLWRAAGKPTPTIKGSPFKDIQIDDYYYNAVLWAYEKGIIKGVDEETFSPNEQVTRAQVVTIQWRADGKDIGMSHDFKDVKEGTYFEEAVSWAMDKDITQGVGYHMFAPNQECTRGEIVTFLYRQFKMD